MTETLGVWTLLLTASSGVLGAATVAWLSERRAQKEYESRTAAQIIDRIRNGPNDRPKTFQELIAESLNDPLFKQRMMNSMKNPSMLGKAMFRSRYVRGSDLIIMDDIHDDVVKDAAQELEELRKWFREAREQQKNK